MQPDMTFVDFMDMTDDECARIEWNATHGRDRYRLDVAAEKHARIAARLREIESLTECEYKSVWGYVPTDVQP